ncbi:MAG TPA: FtsX-like permease family protein [bacterium]|nr:FtsX-like permease family protein [bacterium]
MLTLKLALRTLMRRKGRMILIGALVAFGTFLVVFGTTISSSAAVESRQAIVRNFTGDFIVYSAQSRDLPSPFAFNTPLPNIRDIAAVEEALRQLPEVAAMTPYAQNYGLVQADKDGTKVDLPFIFYAVDPASYGTVFENIQVTSGSFFGTSGAAQSAVTGLAISEYQNQQYLKNYGLTLKVGQSLTLLGITEGGVNTTRSSLVGIFNPKRYRGVFDYINFMDSSTYAQLYNYTGVSSLPKEFDKGLSTASGDEAAIFDLADTNFAAIDLSKLKTEVLSGATMIAVRLKDGSDVDAVMAALLKVPGLGIKTARWDAASGFYAQIATALQGFIYLATALIFLVVALIFMNTLIINVVERTAEIGTMRAVGADKSFVRGLFLAETLILNVSASIIAMIIASVVIVLFNTNGLPLPETVSQFLIGGGPLKLHVSVMPFIQALAVVVLVSVIATIYPVRVATSITPLKAMSDR